MRRKTYWRRDMAADQRLVDYKVWQNIEAFLDAYSESDVDTNKRYIDINYNSYKLISTLIC